SCPPGPAKRLCLPSWYNAAAGGPFSLRTGVCTSTRTSRTPPSSRLPPTPTSRRILEYCRAWHPDGPLVVGVTATPERGDRQSLRQVFDRIVYQKTLLEMMQAGYLVDLRALQVLLQADFDALRTQHGDFVEAELETLLLAANAPAQGIAAVPAARGAAE